MTSLNPTPAETESEARKARGDLNQAEFFAAQNRFQLLAFLPYYHSLLDEISQQEQAEKERDIARQRLAQATANSKEADLRHQSLRQEEWLLKLHRLADGLGARCPEALSHPSPAEEDLKRVEHELRTLILGLQERTERLPRLKEALAAYHHRLQAAGGDFEEAVLHEANVVAATCTGIAGARNFDTTFDHVLIDEAGRATPLDLLIPMVRGKAITLVGDHFQLPPMYDKEVEEQLTETLELKTTLFERVYKGALASRKEALSLQYRMPPAICHIVKELSYKSVGLQAAGEALTRRHPFGERFGAIHGSSAKAPAIVLFGAKAGRRESETGRKLRPPSTFCRESPRRWKRLSVVSHTRLG